MPISQQYGVAQVQVPTYQHVYQQPPQLQQQYGAVHHMDHQLMSPVHVTPVPHHQQYQQQYQQHIVPSGHGGGVDPFFQPELFGSDAPFFKQEPY